MPQRAAKCLADLFTDERVISIIGLAKNTGKTVCLNNAISELTAKKKRLGVTSIGRDGERFDAINTHIPKPHIEVPSEAIVCTTLPLLEAGTIKYDVLEVTDVRTAMGPVVVGLVTQGGTVEVAGPSTVQDMKRVAARMLSLGAELVLVDGALNRKAACSPELSDGVILATGAVLDEDLDEVVSITLGHVEMLVLPQVDKLQARSVSFPLGCKVCGVLTDGTVVPLFFNPLVSDEVESLGGRLPEGLSHLVFRNALVESTLDGLLELKGPLPELVVSDSTRLFVSRRKWGLYRKRGLIVGAQKRTRLLGLTVNPVAPDAHQFAPEEFLKKMRESLAPYNVFDLRSGSYQAANL